MIFVYLWHQERLARIDTEVAEEEERQREEAAYKKQRIDVAEQRRNAPIDDSKMVDEMFGFVDQSSDLADGAFAPSAFQVCSIVCEQYFRWLVSNKADTWQCLNVTERRSKVLFLENSSSC